MKPQTEEIVNDIRTSAAFGYTMKEAAAALGMGFPSLAQYANRYKIQFSGKRGRPAGTRFPPNGRDEAMRKLHSSGKTLEEIGQQYGVTRERVRQILKKHFGIGRKDSIPIRELMARGAATRARIAAFEKNKAEAWTKKNGISKADWLAMPTAVRLKYSTDRRNAERLGGGFRMTRAEWWTLWKDKWEIKKNGRQKYWMSRKDDALPFTPENTFIALPVEVLGEGGIRDKNWERRK